MWHPVDSAARYSDMVCGLMRMLGFDYRPQLADLPDTKLWRINPGADYDPLTTAARAADGAGTIARNCNHECTGRAGKDS